MGSHRDEEFDEVVHDVLRTTQARCSIEDADTSAQPELCYKIRQTVQMMPAHMPLLIDAASNQGRGEE